MCKCNEAIEIRFAKGNPTVIIPSKDVENGGFDIYANFEGDNMVVEPFSTVLIPTELASVIPPTHMFKLLERGSTGTKGIAQRCGVIDSGFRNTWKIPVTNINFKPLLITKETNKDILDILAEDYIIYPYTKAICQAVLIEVPKTTIIEITMEELLKFESLRGLGMLGSTKK